MWIKTKNNYFLFFIIIIIWYSLRFHLTWAALFHQLETSIVFKPLEKKEKN